MSAIASSSSGRIPQGEVIIDFADGGSYYKHKLEDTILDLEKRRITKEEGKKARDAMQALDVGTKSAVNVKSEDVDYIVKQVDCTQSEAKAALEAEKGDLIKALIRLVQPPKRARSVDGGAQ